MIQIPKGSVHIDIRELNLSINYLGESGLGLLKSRPDPAIPLGLTGRASLCSWGWAGGSQLGFGDRERQQGRVSLTVPVLC